MKISNEEYTLFGSRRAINNHQASVLIASPDFQGDLERVRNGFLIPSHLTPASDTYWGCLLGDDRIYDDLFGCTYAHELLNEQNRERFRKAIIYILKKYELGMNFFTWVQWLLLYREPLPGGVALNQRIFEQFASNAGELFRVPKNSQEIKTILSKVRALLGIQNTGRIIAKYAGSYNGLKKALNKTRLKERRPRVDHEIDLKIFAEHGKIETYYNFDTQKNENIKNTYNSLVAKYTPDALEEDDKKTSQRLRKRNERIRKQIKELKS